jgi:hypothetical protein
MAPNPATAEDRIAALEQRFDAIAYLLVARFGVTPALLADAEEIVGLKALPAHRRAPDHERKLRALEEYVRSR